MPLRADLGGELVFGLQPGGANNPGFLDAVDQGLFTIDVFAAVHRPIGDEGVGVIQRAADNGVNIFLLQTLAPVRVALGLGKFLGGGGQVLLIDIAEGDHVFVGNPLEMIFRAVPGGDEGDVKLIARGLGAKEFKARQDKSRRSDNGGGLEELAGRVCTGFSWDTPSK